VSFNAGSGFYHFLKTSCDLSFENKPFAAVVKSREVVEVVNSDVSADLEKPAGKLIDI